MVHLYTFRTQRLSRLTYPKKFIFVCEILTQKVLSSYPIKTKITLMTRAQWYNDYFIPLNNTIMCDINIQKK